MAENSELPKCLLCGGAPTVINRGEDEGRFFFCHGQLSDLLCPLFDKRLTETQWRKLMTEAQPTQEQVQILKTELGNLVATIQEAAIPRDMQYRKILHEALGRLTTLAQPTQDKAGGLAGELREVSEGFSELIDPVSHVNDLFGELGRLSDKLKSLAQRADALGEGERARVGEIADDIWKYRANHIPFDSWGGLQKDVIELREIATPSAEVL